jgi:hypothetical protein
MSKIACGAAVLGAIAVASLGWPATAGAVPPVGGGSSALEQGHSVHVKSDNGNPGIPLTPSAGGSVVAAGADDLGDQAEELGCCWDAL